MTKDNECPHIDFLSCNCGCLVCSRCNAPMDSRECEIGHNDGILTLQKKG